MACRSVSCFPKASFLASEGQVFVLLGPICKPSVGEKCISMQKTESPWPAHLQPRDHIFTESPRMTVPQPSHDHHQRLPLSPLGTSDIGLFHERQREASSRLTPGGEPGHSSPVGSELAASPPAWRQALNLENSSDFCFHKCQGSPVEGSGACLLRAWGVLSSRHTQALEKYCRTEAGFAGIQDVYSSIPNHDNKQQTFFLAETLK